VLRDALCASGLNGTNPPRDLLALLALCENHCVRLASNFAGHTPEGLLSVDVISHSNDHPLSQIMAKPLWVTHFFYSTQTHSNVLEHGSI
jgi:hypothetical protein